MRQLPQLFLEQMQALLGAEFAAFKVALETGEREYAIRANGLKVSAPDLQKLLQPTHLEAVPWSELGLYAPRGARLGANALHHAGAFYVQEASAQAVALALEVKPNLRVLDLCAAPGGKSTHLAALMQNTGVLVCNEISATRAKALAENLERLGCIGVVTNEEPAKLAQKWGASFDRVLVDAPCSGEGMFRKHEAAIQSWSEAHVQTCAVRQLAILEHAAALLAENGVLVYSTCTFSIAENEAVINQFLKVHPEFSLEEIPGFRAGIGGIGSRLFPHEIRGEGHFLARLRKNTGDPVHAVTELRAVSSKIWREFLDEFVVPAGVPLEWRGEIHMAHPEMPDLNGIRALRAGIPVAHLEKNRLEPHHGLSRVQQKAVLEIEADEIAAFLRGETITRVGSTGWLVLQTQGFALGWGKHVGSTIKNHYPKHLRGKIFQLETDED